MTVKLIGFILSKLKAGECLESIFVELLQDLRSPDAGCQEPPHVDTSGHTMLYCSPGVQVWKIGIVDKVLHCILNIDQARGEDLRN